MKNKKTEFLNKGSGGQKGYVVILTTIFVLIIMLSIALTMSSVMFYRQRVVTSNTQSVQSYYAAEAGAEDALLALRNNPNMTLNSYSFNVGSIPVSVSVSNYVGTTRTINVQSNNKNIVKNIQIVYELSVTGSSFYYGIQTGNGGFTFGNGSSIQGNVFTNGSISGTGTITKNAVVAGNGNSISGSNNGNRMSIGGNVLTYNCSYTNITKNLTYVTGGAISHCNVGGATSTQSASVPNENLPISQSQITSWKSEASAGTVINGDYSIDNNTTQTLGPTKITGNLTLNNGSTLLMTGTVYVQGNITLNNNTAIKLSNSYGPLSGVILSDGIITVNNNAVLSGSGQSGSYLVILSTNPAVIAIDIKNGINGVVLYASSGGISLSSNNNLASVHQITAALGIILNNNLTLQYDVGLANSFFTSGPGGSGRVVSWQEE